MHEDVEAVMLAYHRRFRRIANTFLVVVALTLGPVAGWLATADVLITATVTAVTLAMVLAIGWSNRKQTLPTEEVWDRPPAAIRDALLQGVHGEVEPLAGGVLLVPKWPWVAPVWVESAQNGARVVTGSTVARIWRRQIGASIVATEAVPTDPAKPSK